MICRFTLGLVGLAGFTAWSGATELPSINDDMAPPCWRGVVGSTVQKWTFNATNANFTAPNLWAPDTFTNANGTPSVAIVPGQYGRWRDTGADFSTNMTIQGVWNVDPDGDMTFTIPNNASAPVGSYKYVVVQMTEFYLPGLGGFSTITVTNATQVGAAERIDTGAAVMGNHWNDSKTVWRLASSPASEVIGLTPIALGNVFDAVIVDTLIVTPPCHSNIVSANATVTWPSFMDGCMFTNETCTPPSGSTFASGTTPVNCTLTDLYGHANACQFSVTVNTTVPPPQITATTTNIIFSWPQNGTAYTLVKVGDITVPSTNWSPVGIAPVPGPGATWEVRVPAPPTNTFYRLRYP